MDAVFIKSTCHSVYRICGVSGRLSNQYRRMCVTSLLGDPTKEIRQNYTTVLCWRRCVGRMQSSARIEIALYHLRLKRSVCCPGFARKVNQRESIKISQMAQMAKKIAEKQKRREFPAPATSYAGCVHLFRFAIDDVATHDRIELAQLDAIWIIATIFRGQIHVRAFCAAHLDNLPWSLLSHFMPSFPTWLKAYKQIV